MYLASIQLKNFRAVRDMTLDFQGGGPDGATRRWTVLLGENGCGKTSVLKAIGLLLAGSEALPDLLGAADQWIHNGETQAELRAVICTAEGEERKVSLALHRGDGRDTVIKRNAKGLALLDAAIRHADRNYFIAGYGAFRRPPDASSQRSSSWEPGRASQLATLFSHSAQLVSLEHWAMDLDYRNGKKGRQVIADALAKLLPGMSFLGIDKESRSVMMSTVDGHVPLRQLSEGYQAMAAWAGDLLFRMTETFKDRVDPLNARGVLLIDEMDLHLHPVWKRTLVNFLDQAFPHLQIIATTHSPLSVQQCREGELYVVKREEGVPRLWPFKGDPSNLRLSELFLSPLIGLDTLDSPRVAALRDQARDIELKAGRRTRTDLAKLARIQEGLKGASTMPVVEAPELATLRQFQQELQAVDPTMRILASEKLFGSTRHAVLSEPTARPTPTAPKKKGVTQTKAPTKAAPRAVAAKRPTTKKTAPRR